VTALLFVAATKDEVMRALKLSLALLFVAGIATSKIPAAAAVPSQAEWSAAKKSVVLRNGLKMAYVEAGNPKGEPVLLLHGFTDTSRSWSLVAPHLDGYRLLIPDQRGHGASDAPDCCYGSAQMADDARQFLDALAIDRVSVAGHSMGSMVAITMAAEHPERVKRIALLASTALVPVNRGDWLWTQVSKLTFPIDPNSDFIREWAADPKLVEPSFAMPARMETVAVPRHVWRGVMRELTAVPVGRHAADVKSPVLILSGEKDPLFDAPHHAALVKAFPGASSHVFPGLGHNFLWEQPAAVAARLDAFFRDAR
jgi:pimeloyl-ACP methyl ester carboxylesterase